MLDAGEVCAATAFGEAWTPAPVPLRLRGRAQFWARATRLSLSGGGARAHAHTHAVQYAQTQTATGQAGNMTSSYNLDFLPDIMVESRLLAPGDRM